MRTKQRNNLAETARHERFAQNTDVYAVKARNYKGLRRCSPVLCRNNWHIHHGAAPHSYFVHIAESVPNENASNEWLEAVDEEEYLKLR